MKKLVTTLFGLLLFTGTLFAQITVVLTIENQQVVGTDFFFDLYLHTSQASDSLFLGNSDFILTFDSLNFNSPVLTLEGDPFLGAYCTFVPRVLGGASGTQENYSNSIAVSILNGNRLVIDLSGQNPPSQSFFNNRIARIDNTPLTNRLGKFKVSNIQNLNGNMNLQWETSSLIISTYGTTPPFTETQVLIDAIDPPNSPLPVELSSFTGNYKNSEIMLSWKTETEVNNYGFNVERRIGEGEWNTIGFVAGSGNSNSPKEYSYSDKDLFAGGSKFQYRLKQIDNDGSFEYSDVVELEVVPNQYELSQNYPNPFNPSTTIRFSLPQTTQLKINLYNMLGEKVETIAEGTYEAGYYKVTLNASNLPSGTYIYRIESNEFVQVKKLMLLK